MFYADMKGACTPRGYNQVLSGGPRVGWVMEPPPKGPTLVGHFLRVTVRIQAQAGYGGSLWKTLEKKKYKSVTRYKGQFSPIDVRVPVSTRLRNGLGTYRVQVTARVVRNIKLAPDVTAWKFEVAGPEFSCGSSDLPPTPQLPNPNGS